MVNYAILDDEELVNRLRVRDADALEAIYERHVRPVYSLALKMLGDTATAEEVVQEVFLKLWKQPERYVSGRGRLRTWLLGVTHNRAVDELRVRRSDTVHRRTEDVAAVMDVADDAPGPAEVAWVSVQQDAVRRALATLPPVQRVTIELAYFRGMTHFEIAAELNEPLGTVKTRLRLGMQKLRQALEAERIWVGIP